MPLNYVKLFCADFLILFFTEALFYIGVLIFVLLADLAWRQHLNQVRPPYLLTLPKAPRYFQILSVTMKVLTLIIPLVTMGLVWPWTGPAASATLAPYLVGLVVQFAFEQYVRRKNSPSWPVIPIIFQVACFFSLNQLFYVRRVIISRRDTVKVVNSMPFLCNRKKLHSVPDKIPVNSAGFSGIKFY